MVFYSSTNSPNTIHKNAKKSCYDKVLSKVLIACVCCAVISSLAFADNCTYTLDRSEQSVVVAGGSFTFGVTTQPGCSWTAASSDTNWLSIAGDANNTGSGTITLTATPNAALSQRTGTVIIAGQTLKVTQEKRLDVGASTGQMNVLVVMANYSDNQAQPVSLQTVQGLMVNNSNSLSTYISEASYGKATLHVDVADWITLPNKEAEYRSYLYDFFQDALNILDATYDLAQYKAIIFIYVDDILDGTGTIQNYPFTTLRSGSFHSEVIYISSTLVGLNVAQSLLEHEFGHCLGLQHTAALDCQTLSGISPSLLDMRNCIQSSDAVSTMSTDVGQYTAIDKAKIGWLDQSAIVDAVTGQAYVLDQFELASDGYKAIRLPIGTDVDGSIIYYWMDYRAGLGLFDSAVYDSSEMSKLHINTMVENYLSSIGWFRQQQYIFDYFNPPHYLGVADVSLPYRDLYRGIEVQVLSKTGTGADSQMLVTVNRSALAFDTEGVLNFGTQDWANPHSVFRQIQLSNEGNSSVNIADATLSGDPNFTLSSDGCSGVALVPGANCTMTFVYQAYGMAQNVATLLVHTSDSLRPTASVALYGAGTDSINGCNVSLDQEVYRFTKLGGQVTIKVTVPTGCPWQVTPSADWINVSTGTGTGNGEVTIAASPNTGQDRPSSVSIGNRNLAIWQDGSYSCPTTLSQNTATFPGNVQVQISTNDKSCTWIVQDLPSWLTASATAGRGVSSTITLSATEVNKSRTDHTVIFTIGGQTFTATQQGCYAVAGTCAGTFDGDVSGDGQVDVSDALLTMRYLVGLIPHNAANDAIYLDADVAPLDPVTRLPRGNGQVDISDVLGILRHAVYLDLWITGGGG